MTDRRVLQPHGTWAAYNRHYRRGERPCEPCKVASAEHVREWRHRKRKEQAA